MSSFETKQKKLLKDLSIENQKTSFKKVATKLPSHFIPEIMPEKKARQKAISIVKEANIRIVAISLQNFFNRTTGNILLRRARATGLHRFLDYSGEILLTTDVKDRLCDLFFENPSYFRSIVEQLKPDYLTTLDSYTYSNIPACISGLKMLEAQLSMRSLMDLDCRIIGLALGAAPDQILDYADLLTRQGCRIIAHPVYEFRRQSDTFAIRWRIGLSRRLGAKVLLLSCGPGATLRRRVYADYYSNWSWYTSVSSKDRHASLKREEKLRKMIKLGRQCSEQARL
jgi:hypothetical protein